MWVTSNMWIHTVWFRLTQIFITNVSNRSSFNCYSTGIIIKIIKIITRTRIRIRTRTRIRIRIILILKLCMVTHCLWLPRSKYPHSFLLWKKLLQQTTSTMDIEKKSHRNSWFDFYNDYVIDTGIQKSK